MNDVTNRRAVGIFLYDTIRYDTIGEFNVEAPVGSLLDTNTKALSLRDIYHQSCRPSFGGNRRAAGNEININRHYTQTRRLTIRVA